MNITFSYNEVSSYITIQMLTEYGKYENVLYIQCVILHGSR